jgi:hypothetical protein
VLSHGAIKLKTGSLSSGLATRCFNTTRPNTTAHGQIAKEHLLSQSTV